MWERALRRSGLRGGLVGGVLPPPAAQLRPGPAHRGRVAGRVPRRPPRPAKNASPRPPDPGRGALVRDPGTSACPRASVVQAVGPSSAGAAGSLQQEVASCAWDLEVLGVTAAEMTERVERLLGSPASSSGGSARVDSSTTTSARRFGRSPLSRRGRSARRTRDGACRLRAELATQPRGVRPGELLEGLGADLVLARACRTHQWIERDGARWEPLTTSGQPPGSVAPHASERAS